MRSLLRSTAVLLLAVAVATCSDATTAPVPIAVSSGKIALTAVFSTASAVARLADFGITVDHIRIVVVRAPADTVRDTTLVFTPSQPDVALDLTVALRVANETFTGIVEITSVGNGVVLRGEAKVQARATDQTMPAPQPIVITYAGAGASAARIVVAPKLVTLIGLAQQQFAASAVDAGGAAVALGPVHWTTSDPTIATISATGLLQPTGKRGGVTISAVTLANLSDTASATITLPAAAISLVSGSAQSGKAGAALFAPAIVRVTATDGIGVAGVAVAFTAPAGGSVGANSVLTDATGTASTSLTLGPVAGAQLFTATAAGFSVAIPASATAADVATIVAVSGAGQADTVRHALAAPLVALVRDAFNNPVPSVDVRWTRVGAGTLGATVTTTGADGRANVGYTFGNTAGSETITASIAGQTATFSVRALVGAPSTIVVMSGSGQTGTALLPLAAPFVVKIADVAGNPVSGVTVSWLTTNGTMAATTTTDASGLSSNVLTLGSLAGAASATASIAPATSVSFAATAQAGAFAKLAFRSSLTGGTVGALLTPPVQLELQDASGNLTGAVSPVTMALGTNASGGTLAGTLTRSAVAGIATFDDLKLDKLGAYTLVASSGSAASVTSAAFNVAAPTIATQLLLSPTSPTSFSYQAGVVPSTPPAVKAVDVNGTAVPSIPVHVIATVLQNGVPVTVQDVVLTTDANGLVPITGTLPTSAATYTITATSTAIAGATVTVPLTITPAPAARLAITTPPGSPAVSGATLTTQPVVQIQDQFGNAVAAGVIQISATPSGGSASGNVVAASTTTGVATFVALQLIGTGSVTLTFSAPGLLPVTSSAIAMSNTLPAQLTLTPVSPTSFTYQAGVAPTTPPSFRVADAGGVGIANVSVRVLTQNSVPATVSDVVLTSDANGLVAVTGNLPTIAGSYTITATSTAISGGSVVVPLTITAGAATKLAFTVPAATTGYTASAGQSIAAPAIAVAVEDQFSNVVTTSVAPVAVAITAGTGASGAVLSGTNNVAAASGVATFTTLSLNRPSSTYTLTASASGLAPAVSLPIAIVAGPPAQFVFLSQPTAALPGAAVPQFVVQLLDQSGNATTGTNAVALVVASGTSGAVLSGASANAVSGSATFNALSVDREGTYTISATSLGLTPATSSSFLIFDEHAMAFVQTPSGTQTNGLVLSPQPTIQLNDGTAGHNPVLKSGVVITATVAPAPGSTGSVANNTATFTVTGTATATTNANGLATFTNLGVLSTQGGLTGRLTFTATSGTTQTIAALTSDVVVNAGMPTAMQRSTSQVVSTTVGTALPAASFPAVRLVDAGGSPVPNASGLSIVFSAVSGNCSTSNGTATTTDASGVAVIPSLTFPLSPAHSCAFRATSSLSGSPIDFDLVDGPAGGSIWLGATSNDFATGSNWRGGSVPASGANMFIPLSVPNGPQTAAATTIGSLALEAGASFTVGAGVLTINGSTTGGIGSTFTVAGSLGAKATFHGPSTLLGNLIVDARTVQFDNAATITGTLTATDTATITHGAPGRTLTIGGSLTSSSGSTLSGLSTVRFTGSTFPVYGNATTAGTPAVTQIAGNMSVPSGVSTTIARDLTVLDAALTVNGNGTTLTVGGNLDITSSTGASGEVLMTSGTPTMIVTGAATFRGKAQQGQGLTAGTLDLRGDFRQMDRTSGGHGEFEPGANFLVKFTGQGIAQAVSFDHPGVSSPTQSYFTNVLVVNQAGVSQSTDVYVSGIGTMTIGGSPASFGTRAMWTTSSHSLFITGSGTLALRQSGLLTVSQFGTLDLTGGSCSAFDVSAFPTGSLDVNGSVIGGACSADATLVGSIGIDGLFGRQLAARR
jgi:hypothetical protein